MHSKNKARRTPTEDAHIERVKSVPCVCCDASPPCVAHEVVQGDWFTSIALCDPCHVGRMGIHGDQTMMRLRFKVAGIQGEVRAINETLRRCLA